MDGNVDMATIEAARERMRKLKQEEAKRKWVKEKRQRQMLAEQQGQQEFQKLMSQEAPPEQVQPVEEVAVEQVQPVETVDPVVRGGIKGTLRNFGNINRNRHKTMQSY